MSYRVSMIWPFIGTVSIFLIMTALFLSSTSDSNEGEYLKVVEEAALSSAIEPQRSTKQHRKGVKKDIWFTQGGERLQFHINSDESELLFEGQEVVEKMKGVTCILQEELYYLLPDGQEVIKNESGNYTLRDGGEISVGSTELVPMQIVRYIEADHAIYHYYNDKMIAEEVNLSHYRLPGHHLEEPFTVPPLMKGVAKSVEISVMSKELTFKANKMQVILPR